MPGAEFLGFGALPAASKVVMAATWPPWPPRPPVVATSGRHGRQYGRQKAAKAPSVAAMAAKAAMGGCGRQLAAKPGRMAARRPPARASDGRRVFISGNLATW